ncbi:MAG: hypothetical protein MAG451_00521 [Anaerolineales bacterium]|nr:hypothetical protein [Anaerolineales bacterium]
MFLKHINRKSQHAIMQALWIAGVLIGLMAATSALFYQTPAARATGDTTTSVLQADCAPGELIQDGGFEAGLPNPAWQTSSNVLSDILDDSPVPPPRTGMWKAWLGGDNLIQQSLWQTMNVATDTTSVEVSYWWRVDTFETNHPFDTLEVQVRDAAGNPLETLETLTDGDESSTWEQSTLDVSSYAGQTIQIAFVVETDDTNPTSFFLDDVSLTQTCAATPTPTATVEPTPTVTATATLPADASPVYLPLILRSNND